MSRLLANLKELKALPAGGKATFRAKALRVWEEGGLTMALVGDETALTRVEIGDADVQEGVSYEFRDAQVREYPGGWHSASIVDCGSVSRLDEGVEIPQDETYIERTFKILSGIQRKKARREGRSQAWEHPVKSERGKR